MSARVRLKFSILYCAACLLATVKGVVFSDNLHIENGESFLVNSILATSYPTDTQSIETEQFYIYNQNTATKVTARFGNLIAEQNVSYKLNDYSNADPLSLKVVSVDDGANITAHLVQSTVTNTKPNLGVLIHSDNKLKSERCARVYAKRGDRETVSEFCILKADSVGSNNQGTSVVCMVSVPLPYEWWLSRDIDVYYDIQDAAVCTTATNHIRRPSYILPDNAFYIGEVVLMFDDRHGAKEITEDANIGLSIPARPQQAGSPFKVTVNLHPGSSLEIFVVRVELGDGLILKSVESADSDRWNVRMQRAGSGNIVDIEASMKAGAAPSSKIQEVVECNFQVAKSTVILEANIRWSIQYLAKPDDEQFHQRTIDTAIAISKADQVTHLVAVLKTHEMVSLRRFTNTLTTIPVWLYAIDRSGNILQVNERSNCYSLRTSILEVSKLCDMIYLSGEGSDPRLVEVVMEYANIKESVDVRVWYPDVQMSIKLTDDKLSEIKGWKVKKETNEVESEDSKVECNLQYQFSDIKVFTKFYTVHERRDVYMRGGKVEVFADVTPYVRHLIETSDRDIVRFEDGLLRGVSPGKTTVKVVSAEGFTLAAADIRVSSSKTEVDRLSANFVSDMDITVSQSSEQGLLVAKYSYERTLSDKLSEGVVELWVHFTDGKVVPLSVFDRQSYQLDIMNESPSVLALPFDDYQSRYIMVRAVGSGNGALRFTVHMEASCQKKSSRYLSVGYAYIESQLSKPAGQFVNDAAYRNHEPRPLRVKPQRPQKPAIKKKPVGKAIPAVANDPQPVLVKTSEESQSGLTPLETGMFVLMGVLGVVASVFVTNCLIYVYRQRVKKQIVGGAMTTSADGSETVDMGWVWLNRSTLEDNAVNTSPEPLLSDRDFQKRCSRSDSLQSTRSKRSSTGTYKGSECSIRIRVNPSNILNLPDLSDSEDELYSATSTQPVISIEEPELSDLGDMYSMSSLNNSRCRQSSDSEDSECQRSFIVHEEPSSPTSLTQEQFDNLRESVA